jgi:nicotinate-nucleotide pyrophosphorylase (carboxylating)
MTFTEAERQACRRLVDAALAEDLGERRLDLTSQVIGPDVQGQASFVARSAGVLAGLPAAQLVQEAVDAQGVSWTVLHEDGTVLPAGQVFARIQGGMRSILTLERTALNFLQRLSGVATLTRRFVDAVAGFPCHILDTRKTTPGWRLLEKYAVRCGGGRNHRLGLYDGILIKDNHLAALRIADGRARVQEAIRRARQSAPGMPIEIEVDNLELLDFALAEQPDIVLLDNMSPELMREAVRRRNAVNQKIQLEASGGVTLATVRAIAETGVERISVGALTHSAPALDIALDYGEAS